MTPATCVNPLHFTATWSSHLQKKKSKTFLSHFYFILTFILTCNFTMEPLDLSQNSGAEEDVQVSTIITHINTFPCPL